jgi:hypothetical protein
MFRFEKRTGTWEITDVLTGTGEHTAEWFFHFEHGIELEAVSIEDRWESRRYGHRLPARLLHISGRFNTACCVVLTIHQCN